MNGVSMVGTLERCSQRDITRGSIIEQCWPDMDATGVYEYRL